MIDKFKKLRSEKSPAGSLAHIVYIRETGHQEGSQTAERFPKVEDQYIKIIQTFSHIAANLLESRQFF